MRYLLLVVGVLMLVGCSTIPMRLVCRTNGELTYISDVFDNYHCTRRGPFRIHHRMRNYREDTFQYHLQVAPESCTTEIVGGRYYR